MKPLIINFTPTGMIPQKRDVPSVPITSAEIVEQVHEAFEVGITMVHIHARQKNGVPSSKAMDYAPIIEGIRSYCPGLVICASLSGRNVTDPAARCEVLSLKPDMASLTLSSLNFVKTASINSPETIQELAERIAAAGAKPELEVFDTGMVNYLGYLIRKGLIRAPYYVNVLLGNIAGAQLNAAHISALERDLPDGALVSLAGLGQYQLDAHLVSMGLGMGIRVGLEDNVHWDRKKTRLTTNIELLHRIHALAEIANRPMMSPADFGALGFYNSQRHAARA
jgi:uncharacterized protein (DUF849 family)